MRVQIEFAVDNAAFEDNPDEISFVLRQAARLAVGAVGTLQELESSIESRGLRDSNGNTVGHVTVLGDEE